MCCSGQDLQYSVEKDDSRCTGVIPKLREEIFQHFRFKYDVCCNIFLDIINILHGKCAGDWFCFDQLENTFTKALFSIDAFTRHRILG